MEKKSFSELLEYWDISYWGGATVRPGGRRVGTYIVQSFILYDFLNLLDVCSEETEEGLVVWHEESPKHKVLVEDDGRTMYVIWEKRGEKYYPVFDSFFTKEEAEGLLFVEGYHVSL